MTGLGGLLGHLHVHRDDGIRHVAGTHRPLLAGQLLHQYDLFFHRPDEHPLSGYAFGPMVELRHARPGSHPAAGSRHQVCGSHELGRFAEGVAQRTQGRILPDGLYAGFPENQSAAPEIRPLHQPAGHGGQAQGVCHRRTDMEGALPRRRKPRGRSHQDERPLPDRRGRHGAGQHLDKHREQSGNHHRRTQLARTAALERRFFGGYDNHHGGRRRPHPGHRGKVQAHHRSQPHHFARRQESHQRLQPRRTVRKR